MRPPLSLGLISAGLMLYGIPSALANPQLPAVVTAPPVVNGQPAKMSVPPIVEPTVPTPPVNLTVPPQVERTTDPAKDQKNGQVDRPVLVMLDPGHGGKDPGAIGMHDLREIDVILPIALQVAAILKKNGVATQLTRDGDYFVGLNERVQISAQAGASIFVSIHANSIDNRPDVHGLETYYYGMGEELANIVHDKIIHIFNFEIKIPLTDRHVRSARFLVLRKSVVPAILIETGYLSSPTESVQLGQPEYQTRMAQAIAQGILAYLSPGQGTKIPVPPVVGPRG
jgi:N-acetylmuramoyl-L-alanine amidase